MLTGGERGVSVTVKGNALADEMHQMFENFGIIKDHGIIVLLIGTNNT